MANEITITAKRRVGSGSPEARRMRREGWLPAAVNRDSGGTDMIMLNRHDFENLLRHHASEHLVARLIVEEQPDVMVLLREVQHHVRDGVPLHADFREVSMTRKMEVTIPLVLTGEPDGVKNQGGVLEQLMWELDVECYPGDVVDGFEVDVSGLSIGDILSVADVKVGDAYSVITETSAAVATVVASRVEAPESADGEESGAEPEIIGKGKAEEDEAS